MKWDMKEEGAVNKDCHSFEANIATGAKRSELTPEANYPPSLERSIVQAPSLLLPISNGNLVESSHSIAQPQMGNEALAWSHAGNSAPEVHKVSKTVEKPRAIPTSHGDVPILRGSSLMYNDTIINPFFSSSVPLYSGFQPAITSGDNGGMIPSIRHGTEDNGIGNVKDTIQWLFREANVSLADLNSTLLSLPGAAGGPSDEGHHHQHHHHYHPNHHRLSGRVQSRHPQQGNLKDDDRQSNSHRQNHDHQLEEYSEDIISLFGGTSPSLPSSSANAQLE